MDVLTSEFTSDAIAWHTGVLFDPADPTSADADRLHVSARHRAPQRPRTGRLLATWTGCYTADGACNGMSPADGAQSVWAVDRTATTPSTPLGLLG